MLKYTAVKNETTYKVSARPSVLLIISVLRKWQMLFFGKLNFFNWFNGFSNIEIALEESDLKNIGANKTLTAEYSR